MSIHTHTICLVASVVMLTSLAHGQSVGAAGPTEITGHSGGIVVNPTGAQTVNQPSGTTLTITSVNQIINLAALTSYPDVCAAASAQTPRASMQLPQGVYSCSHPINLPAAASLTCPEGYSQTQITFTSTTSPYVTMGWANSIHGCSFVFPSTTRGDGVQLSGYQIKFYDNSVSGGAAGGKLIHITGVGGKTQSGEIQISNAMISNYEGTGLYIDHAIGVNLHSIQFMGAGAAAGAMVIDTGVSGVNGTNVQSMAAPLGGLIVRKILPIVAGAGIYNQPPDFLFFDQFAADCIPSVCPTSDGILLDSSLGAAPLIANFNNSWASGYGHNGVHISGGRGVTLGPGTTVRSNGLNGVLLDNANVSAVTIDGALIEGNNTSNNADAHGVYITAAVNHVNISGGQIGDYPDTTGNQKYGVKVAAVAADNLTLVGTDLRGNAIDCYSNADTASFTFVIVGTPGNANCKTDIHGDVHIGGTLFIDNSVYAKDLGVSVRAQLPAATTINSKKVCLVDGTDCGIVFRTPRSSSATCSQGQTEFDAEYLYICVALDTWRRVETSNF
jgi:hypothetical protein